MFASIGSIFYKHLSFVGKYVRLCKCFIYRLKLRISRYIDFIGIQLQLNITFLYIKCIFRTSYFKIIKDFAVVFISAVFCSEDFRPLFIFKITMPRFFQSAILRNAVCFSFNKYKFSQTASKPSLFNVVLTFCLI